jgi:hypothetical protein
MKSNSRLARKVIVPFHLSFDCTHDIPAQPVIYSDSSPLLSQHIFTFIFCAPVNICIKTAKTGILPKPRFLSISSSLPRADSGPALESIVHSFLFSIGRLLPRPLPRHVMFGAKSQLSRHIGVPKPGFSTSSKLPMSLGHQNIIQKTVRL